MTLPIVLAALILGFAAGCVVAVVTGRRRAGAALAAALGGSGAPAGRWPEQLVSVSRAVAASEASGAAAAASARRLRGVLEGFPAAVLLFDDAGGLREANAAGERLRSGRHGDLLVMDAVRSLLPQAADAAGRSGAVTGRVDLAGPPRRQFAIVAQRLDGGDLLVVVEDVSERRRLEEVRRDFVANISHELKTPIGAIAVLAETMTAEEDPELLSRLSRRMHREALRVGSTIDDLLLLSRIESTDDTPRLPVPVAEVVAAALDRIGGAADARRVEFRFEEIAGPVVVPGDRGQLVSAVANLLDNAVKYSDEGATVVVRAGVEAPAQVVIEVVDRGIGIPTRDLERVFERFYRVDRARSRSTGGTGLGLAIVRHVAHNHGGTVEVRSQEGVGSTFVLRLPAAGVAAAEAAGPAGPADR